jgi:UDP-2,3-diacylglucosamine pyrophosphatase LpxH
MDDSFRRWLKAEILEKDLSFSDLQESYPEENHWELRKLLAETRKDEILGKVDDANFSTAVLTAPTISKRGVEAMQAGWLRPLTLKFDTLEPAEPQIEKIGKITAVISDTHFPDHDPHAMDVMYQICRYVAIDAMVINGDLFHCSSLARYAPSADQPLRWVDEKKQALAEIVKIRQNFPNIPIDFIAGNHDERPLKWINANAVPLQGLFTLPQLLGLDDPNLGFKFVEEGRIFLADGKLLIKHGTSIAASAGASVKKEIDKAGCSVIMGHVHRRAIVEITKTAHEITGVELGCLCNLRPDYLPTEDTANWQQGFAVVTEYEEDFGIELVKIKNGKADFRGLRFVSRLLQED